MPSLYYCSKCQEHHYTTDSCTPSCTPMVTPKVSAGIALVALLGLTACGDEDKDKDTSDDTAMISDTSTMALYGVPFTDNDNDGWSLEDGDCDDDNADVHPGAEETPGDGIDSNCDGEDDT